MKLSERLKEYCPYLAAANTTNAQKIFMILESGEIRTSSAIGSSLLDHNYPVCSYLKENIGVKDPSCPRKEEGKSTFDNCGLRKLLEQNEKEQPE